MCDNGILNTTAICVQPNSQLPLTFYTINGDTYGEARVSKYLLDAIVNPHGMSVQSYRAGYLAMAPGKLKYNFLFPCLINFKYYFKWQPDLPQALEASGFFTDASMSANDHGTHFPIHLSHNRQRYAEVAVYTFPLTFSDGDGDMNYRNFAGSTLQRQIAVAKKIASCMERLYLYLFKFYAISNFDESFSYT